ncbi:putative oxidoreductase [Cladobotryum mycophilum]|uniref:Oxidoreductase n=1 Tax=Cladobotryum mycophilum TaxID=491253 RepID=A0ABR0SQJ5_9HYPO
MKCATLDAVRASNATLKNLGPGLVGVFVGGTSGIGEAILKSFTKATVSPNVYIVGRSQEAAKRIEEECRAINAAAKVSFVQADLTELANVDKVCSEIEQKEQVVNLLVLSPGFLSLEGRNVSSEGLDRKMAVHYYSRMRFIKNLQPLLNRAASSSPVQLSRVMSVLGAGHGGKIVEDDLDLQKNFSLSNCAAHCGTMTDLSLEKFASIEPGTAFVHTSPGVVKTNIDSQLPFWARGLLKVVSPLLSPWTVSLEETGERHLYMATSNRYPPARFAEQTGDHVGAPLAKDQEVAEGSTGERGSGAYLLNWDGQVQKQDAEILKEYRKTGIAAKVWEHMLRAGEQSQPAKE